MFEKIFGRKTVISTRFKAVFVAAMISMLSEYVLILTDSVVAGQIIGEEAVAAMTLVFPMFNLLMFISYVITDGLVMMASYAQGKEDRDEVNRLFSLGMILSVGSGIILFAVLFLFKEEILSMWEISERLKSFATDYYSGLMWLSLIICLNTFIYTFFFVEGQERGCVIASGVSFFVNITMSLLLAETMGVEGIGLATTLGNLTAVLVQVYYLTGGRSELKFSFYFDLKKTLRGFFYSFYHSIDTLCLSIFPVLLTAATIQYFGEERIIVATVGINLIMMLIQVYVGLVDCLQPMICQYHAENNLHSVKETILLGIKVTAALSLLMTFVGIIFSDFLPKLFGVDDGTKVDEVAGAMEHFLPFTIFLGITLMLANYYIYVEKMNFGATIKIILLLVAPYVGMKIGGNFSLDIFWLSIGLSFAATFLLEVISTKFFKGNGNILLIDEKDLSRQLSYNEDTIFDDVMNLTRTVNDDLKKFNVDEKRRNMLVLYVEEIGLHAVERAEGKIFQLEFSFLIDEKITMIVRDNGDLYDILKNAEEGEFSFREFFIDSITDNIYGKNYLASGDENRMILRI